MVALKCGIEAKSSWWAEIWAGISVVSIWWSEKWPKMEIYASEQQWITGWLVRGLKEALQEDEGRGMQRGWRGGYQCEDVYISHPCSWGSIFLIGYTWWPGGQDDFPGGWWAASAFSCPSARAMDPWVEQSLRQGWGLCTGAIAWVCRSPRPFYLLPLPII